MYNRWHILLIFLSPQDFFSDLLKISNSILVFKKENSQDYNNDGPISPISNLNKLIKNLVHKRLYNFFEITLPPVWKKYSFCTKATTTHAFIDIKNKIPETCGKSSFACSVFVDFDTFDKAFDAVNHIILLHKLKSLWIKEDWK